MTSWSVLPPQRVIVMSVVLSLCESEASLTHYLSPPPPPQKRHNYVCCILLVRNQFDVMIRPPLSTRHNNVCCTLPFFESQASLTSLYNSVLLYVPFLQTGACTDIAHYKAKNQSTVKTCAHARVHTHTAVSNITWRCEIVFDETVPNGYNIRKKEKEKNIWPSECMHAEGIKTTDICEAVSKNEVLILALHLWQ